jgi:hypothetical protein
MSDVEEEVSLESEIIDLVHEVVRPSIRIGVGDEDKESQPEVPVIDITEKPKAPLRKRKNKKTSEDASAEQNSKSPAEASSSPDVSNGPKDKRRKEPGAVAKKRKIDVAPAPDASDKPGAKKSKKDQTLEHFLLDTLPALRKNMKQAKIAQSSFKIRDHNDYFKANSRYIPTFILPLFHFLAKEEINCSKIADFDGKKFVKTDAGFVHASFISHQAVDLTEEDVSYLMRKYGKEWFKIPSKDYVKAVSASKYGDKGEFKVTLIGVYEDSFVNSEGQEILTINPILRYDSCVSKKKEKETPAVTESK